MKNTENGSKAIKLTKQTVRDLKVRTKLQAGRGTMVTCVKGWCLPA